MPITLNPANIFNGQAVLLGIATPLSDIVLPTSSSAPVLAVITVQHGALLADIAPGATVRGSGSSLLSIAGSVAQINAKLATLSYIGATSGPDVLTVTAIVNGQATTATRVNLAVTPLVNPDASLPDVIAIDHGTLTLDSRTIDGPSLMLAGNSTWASAPTAILINTTLGAHSALSLAGQAGAGTAPRVAMAGRVELDGATSISGTGASISMAQGATLLNEGRIMMQAGSALFSGTGTIVNDGSIALGGGASPSTARIDPAVTGTGTIQLGSNASLWLNAGFGAGGTVALGAGAQTLHLASASTFAGTIAGFSYDDTIVLDGTKATTAIYTGQADGQTGTLSLFDADHLIGALRFAAPEAGTVFQLGADTAGNITIEAAKVLGTGSAANPDVFRFFDAQHGTQLLTADITERDTILATRPDLRFEGTAFKAAAPDVAAPNTVNVYRFFDTSNGTHFLTSNLAERDAILTSRPDMVFEPGSTLVEHASAQAGDVAVYRFFDQRNGAHFFTASQDERASILANRPDMTAEGIAFYAPGN